MAAADAATVFVETTLGTGLVVPFLTSATTVADLKRRMTAEHSACFPEAGPIAVKSLQVQNDDGFLFYLNDHVPVEAAFRWVKGPWMLLVEARELGSRTPARGDADRGSGGGSEQNAGAADVSDSPLLHQVDGDGEGVDHASEQDKSMKESNERPASNDQFLRKRKHEGATSTVSKEEEPTVSKEEEPCSMRRRQRIVTVRKMPISKAAKIFGLRL